MDRTYDLFEVVEGELVWRSAIVGHENAIRALQQLAKRTTNEIRLMHLLTRSLVASTNVPPKLEDPI
jgi:hypothetical protein